MIRRRPLAITGQGATALAAAQKVQGEAAERWPEINVLAIRMMRLRARNQFAEQIRYSLRRSP